MIWQKKSEPCESRTAPDIGLMLFSQSFEEIRHELAALLLEQAAFDRCLGMNRTASGVIIAEKSPFRVGSAIDYPSYLAPSERAGAHGAWFHCDI